MIKVRYQRHNIVFRGSFEQVTFEADAENHQDAVKVTQRLKVCAAEALGLEEPSEEEVEQARKTLDRYARRRV